MPSRSSTGRTSKPTLEIKIRLDVGLAQAAQHGRSVLVGDPAVGQRVVQRARQLIVNGRALLERLEEDLPVAGGIEVPRVLGVDEPGPVPNNVQQAASRPRSWRPPARD